MSSEKKEAITTEYLTVPEVAKYLNCSASYVRYLIRDQQIAAVRIGMKGRGTRIARKHLEKFLESRTLYTPQD